MKFVFSLVALLVCLSLTAMAQNNPPLSDPGQPSKMKQQGAATEPAHPKQNSSAPAASQEGRIEQPNQEVVPRAGAAEGAHPRATQPQTQPKVLPQATVTSPAEAKDQELSRRIEKALKSEPTLSNAHVEVDVEPGKITLTGTVANGFERRAATRIARSFAGDREVVDRLTVTGASQKPREKPLASPPH